MPTVKTDVLDKMMERIRNMLARADHPTTPKPEADTARAQAEKLMRKYRIAEEELIASGDAVVNGLNVLFREMPVYNVGSKYSDVYRSLVSYAITHTGCQGVFTGSSMDGERLITIVGYEADIRYAEALYTNARLLFADRMEPKVDPNLSDMENVYRLRSAGLERRIVAEHMGWVKGGAKVTRLYKQACEARGEEPILTGQGTMVDDYIVGYCDGFKNEFWSNLYHARIAVDAEVQNGGMVLHGREERIKEACYQRWPELRPSTEVATRETKPVKYKPPTKAELRAMDKRNNATARAGARTGRSAAAEVDIKGQTPIKRLGN
jgi:hypothetical protein